MKTKKQSTIFSIRCDFNLLEDFDLVAKTQNKTRNQAIVELIELFAYHNEEKYLRWKAKFAAKEFHYWKSLYEQVKEKKLNEKDIIKKQKD